MSKQLPSEALESLAKAIEEAREDGWRRGFERGVHAFGTAWEDLIGNIEDKVMEAMAQKVKRAEFGAGSPTGRLGFASPFATEKLHELYEAINTAYRTTGECGKEVTRAFERVKSAVRCEINDNEMGVGAAKPFPPNKGTP